VTTGPVTVPILIALGVSVMKAQRQKQQAFAAIEDAAVNRSEGEWADSTHTAASQTCTVEFAQIARLPAAGSLLLSVTHDQSAARLDSALVSLNCLESGDSVLLSHGCVPCLVSQATRWKALA
jgi:hypothetical protein